MIILCRVDHRLLHGQVAFSWTNTLGADCILVANDEVPQDDMWKTTLKLAKPANVKLVIKDIASAVESINSGVTDKYKLLIIVRTVKDAYTLAQNCAQIKSINLGGTKKEEGDDQISSAVFLSKEDKEMINELLAREVEVEIRQLASDSKQKVQTF